MEEPTEETGPTSGSVGILSLYGEEDVKAYIYCSYWRAADLSTPNGERFAHSLHGLVSTRTGIAQLQRCKECRSHIVLLFPRAGKILDRSEDPS